MTAEEPLKKSSGPGVFAAVLGHGLAPLLVCPLLNAVAFGFVYRSCGSPEVELSRLVAPTSCDVSWTLQFILLVLLPALHTICSGPTVWIRNTVSVRINAPLPVCSQFVQDARNLAQYEQKVVGCDAFPGGFTIWGSWFGLPFAKTFDMTLFKGGGFHSVVRKCAGVHLVPSIFQFHGSGGFRTEADKEAEEIDVSVKFPDDGAKRRRITARPTKLVHYEKYGWPVTFPYMPLIAIAWRVWHRRGMEVEMELIKKQVEHIFKEVHKSSVDASKLECASHYAADYGDWGTFKYGASDYLQEMLSNALCRPYQVHHPSVDASCWKTVSEVK